MFILDNYDDFETTKEICRAVITDMYVVKALTYITFEKEDETMARPNMLKVFSLTRGLDVLSPNFLDDLIETKYGKKFRFFGDSDHLNTILAFQSPGVWKTGVQFLQYELDNDVVNESMLTAAVEFSENFATIVSSITLNDLWLLRNDLKNITDDKIRETYKNLQSRHFETSVQDFLRTKYHYSDIVTRYKPPYLDGKEIDVYAKKGQTGEPKTIMVCECKLKFSDDPVQVEEVTCFVELVTKIQKHETELANKEGGSAKLKPYLVTNSSVSPATKDFLNSQGVQVMITQLPANWHERGDWKIAGVKENKLGK